MTAAVKGAFYLKLIYCVTAVNDLDSCPLSGTIQMTVFLKHSDVM